jgi:hypothetical protein
VSIVKTTDYEGRDQYSVIQNDVIFLPTIEVQPLHSSIIDDRKLKTEKMDGMWSYSVVPSLMEICQFNVTGGDRETNRRTHGYISLSFIPN